MCIKLLINELEFFDKNLEEYSNLPDEVIIPAVDVNLTASNKKNFNNDENWTRSHGNHSSNKFSNLKLINKDNIKNLDVAWTYSFENKGDIPGNPIYYDGKVYLSSTEKSLKEHGDKISAEDKEKIETSLAGLKDALKDNDIENIK